MRVLVTGGAGFIGSHLCEKLLGNGHDVICIDNFDPFYPRSIKESNLAVCRDFDSFALHEADIRDREALPDLFKSSNVEFVVHLAAKAGVRPSISQPNAYYDVNVAGTLNLLESARMSGVTKTLFASSSSVYGNNPKVPYSESDPVDHPISPYAATKKAGELLCYTYHHLYDISVFCFRFFTAYGPRQRPEMAIHKFTRQIFEGQTLQLYGEGKLRRDYTYINDIIQGLLNAMDRLEGYEVFNLGESRTTSLLELVNILGEKTGKKPKTELLPVQPGDVDQTFADISKARQLLGFDPNTDLEQGIGMFVNWFRLQNGLK